MEALFSDEEIDQQYRQNIGIVHEKLGTTGKPPSPIPNLPFSHLLPNPHFPP